MKIKSLIKHNLMRAAITLALIMACATAWAQTKQSVTYIDENGQTQTVDATLLTASTSSTDMSGWYVASGTFTNNNRLAVNYDYATLNLILADDCHLTMTKGLQVPSHATLNIYSQSKGSSMGKLTITTPDTNYAGIGGSANPNHSIPSGNINIYGGDLNITGGSGGAGIGGGRQAAAQGAILITNGAKVVATGGFSGAGIGGGYQASFSSITITGNATVTASATNGGEAIGRGQGASQSGTLSITNSTVNNVHYDADGFQDGSTHTVTFNSQGGTAVAAQTVGLKYGQTIVKANEPTVPTRTYYVFGGWYKESNCTNAWDFDNDAVTEDITLYAKWTPDPDHFSVSNDGNTYTIHTATGWGLFCDALQDNETYNHFSGKTVELGANITVTQMAGGSNHAFTGTFDGNHKTLTLNYGTVQAPIDAEFVAPFVEVSGGATFINLNIDGHIYAAYTGSSDPGVGGLIGHLFGGITIEGCTSTVEINSTKDRVGGFVGLCEHAVTFTDCKSSAVVTCTGSGSGFVGWSRDSNYTIAFYGCLFNGKVLKKNGVGSGNGGFVGWKGYHKTVEITNCLVDPAAVAEGETMADDNSATFCRYSANTSLDNQATSITNCYYTETFGNAQGTQAYSISGGDYVTVGNAGTVSNNYTTSGLTFYNVGLKYGDVLYAASNDEVSLTLGCTLPEGYVFNGYTVSPTEASLTGNDNDGYTLTMPNGNVTINATLTPIISYIDENGETQQCTEFTLLTGNETSLGTSGQETWYVADGTLNYSEGIQLRGNTHIILADGKTMTITSSDGDGIDVDGSLTIYGQELGTGTLNATGNNRGIVNGDITIIGGTVNATGNNGIYSVSGDITIIGGTLNATGNDAKGIYSSGDITIIGGTVNATGNDNGIHSYSGNITISGGTVTATDNSTGYGIFTHSGNITISGGRVTATSENGHGIYSYDGTTTLGWTNATDFIYVSRYYIGTSGTLNIAEGKAFKDVDGNNYESGPVNASDINGKWLYPNTVSLFTKIIAAHHTEEGVNYGWYLIASPLTGGTNAEAVAHLVNSKTPANFDLYRFNQAADLEWENWKQQNSDHYHFNLEPGRGYLYANAAEVNLVFAGTPYSGNGKVTLQKTEGAELSGWNLVGNPFAVSATLSQPFYRMNPEGTALSAQVEAGNTVEAMEGVFVQANEDSQTVTFTAQTRGGEKAAIAQANIMVGGNNGAVIDNAIVRFDGGQTLEKFSFREGSTKLYIPQDGKDYAIACAESTGEMPVNFKAETDGTYTISVNVDNVEMGYLHLIDNMTGSDIDLLAMNNGDARPCVSTYTFTAKTTDYESRFKLVFAVGSSTGSDTFAFFSNGNWIVSNEGHATLQVIDVNGRILISEQINGSISKAINQPAGVYMLRLVKGENVRTQKIVVE